MRSKEPITLDDLKRLADIARDDRKGFFARYQRWSALYSRRLLCVALCQGAALHFIDGTSGIKDFDVWSFFRECPDEPIPRRPVVHRDFGHPRFGTSPCRSDFIGRKVDLLMKSVDGAGCSNPIAALHRYLSRPRTKTARCLAQKAVVVIEPREHLGTVAWPLLKAA